MDKFIEIKGLKEHNLDISELKLPLNQLIGLIGPSGSGKSTLGRTLFLEGRRLYLESLGLDKIPKLAMTKRPKANAIKGLPPAVYLEQIPEQGLVRSSVGKLSDIDTFLKIFFSIAGTGFCPSCNIPIETRSMADIVNQLASLPQGTRFALMMPNPGLDLSELHKEGFVRIEKDGVFLLLDEVEPSDKELKNCHIVLDRIITKPGIASRIEDSIRLAVQKGSGIIKAAILGKDSSNVSEYINFSLRMICPSCLKLFPDIEPGLFSKFNAAGQCPSCKGKGCKKCDYSGLSDFTRNIKVDNVSYYELINSPVNKLKGLFDKFYQKYGHNPKISPVIEALQRYISTIVECGLDYLELSRPVTTLSRGELQKLRLAIQIHKGLSGCLVILDEPTVGLHGKEITALKKLLTQLKDSGNSVIVIEHDREILSGLDWIVELGPGGGAHGGKVCFNGPCSDYFSKKALEDEYEVSFSSLPTLHKKANHLSISDLTVNNLRQLSIKIPLNRFITITGPSGSGKTTLVQKGIIPLLKEEGFSVHVLDQSPLRGGRNSIVATYLNVFTPIRSLFARTKGARARGFSPATFSLSKKGGRCEECKGLGILNIEIQYLPPVETICPVCSGHRYMPDILTCVYRDKNISDILSMTIDEASDFFLRIKKIREVLTSASQAGVGYLALGQPTEKLSGGERMRVRLGELLAKIADVGTGLEQTCIVLDEPTAGLHPNDVRLLIKRLKLLSEQGMTVIVIDDDKQILSCSDWLVELGPGGGPKGGKIIKNGPPF